MAFFVVTLPTDTTSYQKVRSQFRIITIDAGAPTVVRAVSRTLHVSAHRPRRKISYLCSIAMQSTGILDCMCASRTQTGGANTGAPLLQTVITSSVASDTFDIDQNRYVLNGCFRVVHLNNIEHDFLVYMWAAKLVKASQQLR